MDIGASNWNEADASNTTAAPDGAPEGMAPSGVNDTIRAVMGAIKRWYSWSSSRLTGGTSTAYTLTYSVSPSALVDGMTHLVQFHVGNGPGATLNVNGLSAKPLHYYSAGAWRAVPPALFDADTVCQVVYHTGTGAYRLLLPDATPTGIVKPCALVVPPGGYLLCYGQAVSRTAYAGLFAAIGTTYGAGDGSTTFNLPDLRGRGVAGKSDMGGSDAGNLAGAGILGAALGGQVNAASTTVSGTASGTLTGTADADAANEVASAVSGSGAKALLHTHSVWVSGSLGVNASGTTSTFSVVQPTRVLNLIIRI